MDNRVVEFIRGLRAAGVRVSLAESMDAMRAIGVLGVTDKALFQESLRTTLVKESRDFPIFDQLFPLYFGSGGPPMQNALEKVVRSSGGSDTSAATVASAQKTLWLTERIDRNINRMLAGDGDAVQLAQRLQAWDG